MEQIALNLTCAHCPNVCGQLSRTVPVFDEGETLEMKEIRYQAIMTAIELEATSYRSVCDDCLALGRE